MRVIENSFRDKEVGAKEFVQSLFYPHLDRLPNSAAVRHGKNILTYAQLDQQSTTLAAEILKQSPDSANIHFFVVYGMIIKLATIILKLFRV